MRWHQSLRMRLTISNLRNAIPNNHALTHAFKQTQIIKNHRILINSATIAEKMATLSHNVSNDKLINILKSI